MRVLVTGSGGQLGGELRRLLSTMGAEAGPMPEVYRGAEADYVGRADLDISDGAAVGSWFAGHAPYDLVVNCAAATDVDGCEADEEGAYRVNALGPQNLARACASQGAELVQVSTDYVFAGDGPGERSEGDPVGPASAYGRTKLAGEGLALAANPRTYVCRTAWLYGYEGKNFVKTMRRLGASRPRVEVVCDQLGNPTSANDLAYAILLAAQTGGYGVWHMSGRGTCSWADLAARTMERSGLACEVVPVTTAEYLASHPQAAPRPAFSSLRNARLEATVGDPFRPWEEALDMYVGRLNEMEA